MEGPRAWLLYAAGWLPLFAVYALGIRSAGEPLVVTLASSLYNVLPLALLGVLVVRLCARWPYPAQGLHPRFLVAHDLAAIAYAVAATAATVGLVLLHQVVAMGRVSLERFQLPHLLWQVFVGLILYAVLAGGAYALELRERLREEEARAARAEALRSQAELQALRAQLNPHFLFNTLHSVLSLVRRDPLAAEDALERIGDLLRYSLRVHEEEIDEVELASEWDFAMSYLRLEGLRLGDRLRLEAKADQDALRCRVLAFSLQPLVENAVRHGVAPRCGGGNIEVRAVASDGALELTVFDDGPGAAADELDGGGIGLRLLRQRLHALHGSRASLEARRVPGGFQASLRLPAFEEEEEDEER